MATTADPSPDLTNVAWSNQQVLIYWTDRSTDEDLFHGSRLNKTTGVIEYLVNKPTSDKVGTGTTYMFVDSSPIIPTQEGEVCYYVVAYDSTHTKVTWISTNGA